MTSNATTPSALRRYNLFLQLVAGLGGLLYGVDVGIIGGALPYLNATSHLTPGQLSAIVAAVLLGSVFSTLFAGIIADFIGRKPFMILCGLCFIVSIPVIALSQSYEALFLGRLLQGVSAGFIGIVVPLYLAECLSASTRGKGTAIFQWFLTLGIVAAALVGMYYSYRVQAVTASSDATTIFHFKDQAWRRIFWLSLPPGILFVLGGLMVTESPRWLFRRGKKDAAYQALLRSRTTEQATSELREMEETARVAPGSGDKPKDSLFSRKYVIPFILTCVILSCNTATGINSVVGYCTATLLQSGLSDLAAHWGYVILTATNFSMTMIGMLLVDRKGRRFLLTLGTAGIVLSMISVGSLFLTTEKYNIDTASLLQSQITPTQELTYKFDSDSAAKLLATSGYTGHDIDASRASLGIIYAYGDYPCSTSFVRSDDTAAAPLHISREDCVPSSAVESFFKNPFANLEAARTAPLRITKAPLARVPDASHGWLVAIGLYAFIAFYAMGPGVVVWIALSELMPTRIRSNGMSIALVLNQSVSTALAAVFLPFVSRYGYSRMFFLFAAFALIYFLAAALFLPETKGKTLEEIEAHFAGKAKA
ncbi:sugar porter family MFS transporter [Acidicapsa dinghuensis]|uniref:Sugar porter family MFS transporter n=1 Tax=Acidicapsa dinghuensis TaxID=2218256 RepID=A0ABW1EBI2_9BACT|nr:sugar porter family MFS transporter [Acidicapsa dinghuensis]